MKKYKQFIAGFLVGALLFSFNSVFASNRTIEAFYNDIKLSIDGKITDLKDAAGNKIEPFILDGTTYAPARAIAESLGMEVKYNETTNTVEMTKKILIDNKKPKITDEVTLWNITKEDDITMFVYKDGLKYVDPNFMLLDNGLKNNDSVFRFRINKENSTGEFYNTFKRHYDDIVQKPEEIVLSNIPAKLYQNDTYLISYDEYKNNILPKLLAAVKK